MIPHMFSLCATDHLSTHPIRLRQCPNDATHSTAPNAPTIDNGNGNGNQRTVKDQSSAPMFYNRVDALVFQSRTCTDESILTNESQSICPGNALANAFYCAKDRT